MRTLATAAAVLALASAPAWAQGTSELWGVAASRRPDGPVLVWSASAARLSADGDAPFRVVAGGEPPIREGAVGDDGGWALLRQGSRDRDPILEVHDARGAVRVRDVPLAHHVRMGAGLLVLSTPDGLEVSDDGGRTFTRRPGPEPCKGCGGGFAYTADVGITARGSVVVADTEINTCGSSDLLEWQRRLEARGGGPLAQRPIRLPRDDYAAQFRVGAHGWLYGVTYARRLFAVGGGDVAPVAGVGPATHVAAPPLLADNGRITLAVHGGRLVRLEGARAIPLGPAPDGVRDLAVDGRGRALALTDVGLLRFGRATGWERLPLD